MENNEFFYENNSDDSRHILYLHSYGGPCMAHFHIATEIIGVIAGSLEIIVNDQSYVLRAGEIAIIPRAHVHTFRCSDGNQNHVLTISQNVLSEFNNEYPLSFDFFLRKGPYTKKLFETFELIEKNWKDSNYMMKYGLINYFFGLLAKAYPPTKKTEQKTSLYPTILVYIEEHLFDDINLEQISTKFGYTKNYFSSIFNKAMGIHFKDYVNRLRIQKAKARLDKPNRTETVLTIAQECGFNSLNSFYRALNRFYEKPLKNQ